MKSYTGKIISLAFPDTFVRFSDEHVSHLLPLFGLGKKGIIKAGHAAFVLIDNSTGSAEYYDFGRYVTPKGKGRVRSAVTDVELEIPFKASFTSEGELANTEEFLLWLEANPEKTHGAGRLVASVCDYIYYDKAKAFVLSVQDKGSVPYMTFGKEGSNCSRIVTDTILAATDVSKIRIPLLRNKLFTPSPLGNVEKSKMKNRIYQVAHGVIKEYPESVFVENLTNYFDKNIPVFADAKYKEVSECVKNAHFLSGIGSGAYFKIENHNLDKMYRITRYDEYGTIDFIGVFVTDSVFDIAQEYEFVYDSHCKYCHIKQRDQVIKFDLVNRIS